MNDNELTVRPEGSTSSPRDKILKFKLCCEPELQSLAAIRSVKTMRLTGRRDICFHPEPCQYFERGQSAITKLHSGYSTSKKVKMVINLIKEVHTGIAFRIVWQPLNLG
jgi:hypothetical protein